MIIKLDSPGIVSPGKIGGHYIQDGPRSPSLRTKRNGGNKFKQYSRAQRGYIQSQAKAWNGLTNSQKASFLTYANANPAFDGISDFDDLKAFKTFATLNSKLRLANYSPITSVGSYFAQPQNGLRVSSVTWDFFTIVGNQRAGTTGQTNLFFVQMNLGVTADPQERNVRMCFAKVGFSTSISGFSTAVNNSYNQKVPYQSISVRIDRINSNGRVYEPGRLQTFHF